MFVFRVQNVMAVEAYLMHSSCTMQSGVPKKLYRVKFSKLSQSQNDLLEFKDRRKTLNTAFRAAMDEALESGEYSESPDKALQSGSVQKIVMEFKLFIDEFRRKPKNRRGTSYACKHQNGEGEMKVQERIVGPRVRFDINFPDIPEENIRFKPEDFPFDESIISATIFDYPNNNDYELRKTKCLNFVRVPRPSKISVRPHESPSVCTPPALESNSKPADIILPFLQELQNEIRFRIRSHSWTFKDGLNDQQLAVVVRKGVLIPIMSRFSCMSVQVDQSSCPEVQDFLRIIQAYFACSSAEEESLCFRLLELVNRVQTHFNSRPGMTDREHSF